MVSMLKAKNPAVASFTADQQDAIARGSKKRMRLMKVAGRSVATSQIRPTYIYSPPGLGKTFSVNEAIKATGVKHYNVNGNSSMFAFGVDLAVFAYLDPITDPIVVNVDDCDELLKNEQNINILKNLLEGQRAYTYSKNMTTQIANLADIQQEAIEHFAIPNRVGFKVPCKRMAFIFTSNLKLPTDDDVLEAQKRGRAKASLLSHRNAIRSRCQTNDFDLSWDEQWGWIADVVLNTPCLDDQLTTVEEKAILLDWMFDNWEDMTERSIRTAEKMAMTMVEDPTGYTDDWEIDFLK